ncbi:metallophosphoesterase [Prevotella dentasini]
MIVPILLFFLLLVCPDIYIWATYIAPGSRWWADVAWFAPSAAALVSFGLFNRGVYHNTFMRSFIALALCVGFPKLTFFLLQFAIAWQWALGVAIAVVAALVYGFFFGWRRIVVKTATCESELLPPLFDGYRILQMSDLHIGTFRQNPGFIDKLVRLVNEQQADMVAFTGDLVNLHADELLPFVGRLSQIKAPDGVYSIMGNHDYCEYGMETTRLRGRQQNGNRRKETKAHRNQAVLEYLEEKMGWRMLMNENVVISRPSAADGAEKAESIAVIGVENIGKPPFKSMGNLPEAMNGLTEGTFKILLSHDPTHWRHGVLHQTDIALTLSGHTHAGQLKLGKFSPAKWAYNEWGGKYTEGGSMLYVSLGLGGTVPFRFGAWPEVNVITLRTKKP